MARIVWCRAHNRLDKGEIMARFTVEQAADVAAIQQVINEWGDELDQKSGTTITERDILTQDCRYNVGGEWREGLAATAAYYKQREATLLEQGGLPVMRHTISNFRVEFSGETEADVNFLLLFFMASGTPPITGYCDPIALAEVHMTCRREDDGHWRISMFDSGQTFRRG
jgi:hypothetical protein